MKKLNIFRIFCLFLLGFAIILAAQTAEAKKVSASKSYKYKGNPKFGSIVVDADSGKILSKDRAEKRRHPASLTKMMTLYLTFEALKSGKLQWHQKLKISKEAASRPQTNLSLKAGSTIRVRDAAIGLIVRSANDAAVVLAEKLGGSESGFAKIMTERARQLGMKNTTFKNASGLHNPKQVTTAKDMALLAIALKKHYPQYYHYFSRTSITYNGRTYKSHNKVMQKYTGADGLKTGYVRASGFNLVTSAKRSGQNIVGVVLGGRSSKRRDDHMVKILDKGFVQLAEYRKKNPVRSFATNTRTTATSLVKKPVNFIPKPVSKGYFVEGGYESYAAAHANNAPTAKQQEVAAIVEVIRGKKLAKQVFNPTPMEKPRFLARR